MRYILTVFLGLYGCIAGIAQESANGRLVDSLSHAPLANASVVVLIGGKAIHSTSSNAKGEFYLSLPVALSDSTWLELSLVGYSKKRRMLASEETLGDISLSPNPESLSEATVSAKAAQPIRIDPEKLSYSVAADGLARAENVLQMLKRVPMVEVRDDKYILVNGSSTIITINNREHPLLQNNPDVYLQSLPATSVADVEVYTTPSVKFNSATRINLVVKEPLRNTYSGTINIGINQLGTTSLRGSYGISRGKLASQLLLNGGALHQQKSESWGFRESYTNGTTESYSRSGKQAWSLPYSGSYTASYELSKQSLFYLTLSAQGSEPLSSNGDQANYQTLAQDGTTLSSYTIENTMNLHNPFYSIKANYQYSFTDKPDRLLTFSYDGSFINSDVKAVNQYNGIVNYLSKREDRNGSIGSKQHTFQTDYVHPAKWGKLESGLKYIRRDNSSTSQFYRYENGNPVIDSLLSSSITHSENVGIAYLSYSRSFGKYFVMAGGRLEYSDVRIEKQNLEPFTRDFFRPVPMVSLARMLGKMSKLNFSYSMRSEKPGITQLDPAVDKRTANLYFVGNPNLKSMTAHNLSLGFNSVIGRLSVNTTLSYTRSLDGIASYSYLTTDDNLFITYSNAEQGNKLMLSTYESIPLFRGMTLYANGSLAYAYIKNSLNSTINDGWEYSFMPSLDYKPISSWIFRLNGGYNTGRISMQSTQKGYLSNSLSAAFIPNNHLTLGLNLNNPFTPTTKTFTQTYGDNYYSENTFQRNALSITLSVSYRFWGDVRVKSNKRNIVIDDVYSGGR